jgi:glutathione S-transferase
MPVEYVDFEEARRHTGLRLVVVPGVPSPWGEAAKGILHVKRIPYVAVRLDQGNAELREWTGETSGPVALYQDERPRSGWAEILLLAERLAPTPALVPPDPADRMQMMGLAHEICGEMGLGWCARNAAVHASLTGGGGFPEGIARYLGEKYGYRPEEAALSVARVVDVLGLLGSRLRSQREAGSRCYLGDALTALDIYSATFMALFAPLPPEQCPMPDAMRAAFRSGDEAVAQALDPVLLEHRDFVYESFLELPLSL